MTFDSARPSVLIVEDEPLIAAHQTDIVTGAGYGVLAVVRDAEAALKVASEAAPDLAIIDVSLVGSIDGLTVGRELNRRYGTAIVFVTGQLERAVRQSLDMHAAFVGKPFDDTELLQAMQVALRRGEAEISDRRVQ